MPTRVVLVFIATDGNAEHEVDLRIEDAGRRRAYTAVVQLSKHAAYTYTYRLWHGQKSEVEHEEREVIPTRRRELVMDKFGEHGKGMFVVSLWL